MMSERLAELLAVRAVAGRSAAESRELKELLAQHPEIDEREYELAVASLQLEPLPESLRERVLRQATRESPPRVRWWGEPSWWIAAIVLALAVFLATLTTR